MPKETMRAKIERLEGLVASYEASLEKANNTIIDMQEKANEAYMNSTDRKQLEHENERNREYKRLYERLKDEHEAMKNEFKGKSERITELNNEKLKLLEEISLKDIEINTLKNDMDKLKSEKGVSNITKEIEQLRKTNADLRRKVDELQVRKDIKGVNARGAGRHKTIKADIVRKVKEKRKQGDSMKKIAESLGISVGSVFNILKE